MRKYTYLGMVICALLVGVQTDSIVEPNKVIYKVQAKEQVEEPKKFNLTFGDEVLEVESGSMFKAPVVESKVRFYDGESLIEEQNFFQGWVYEGKLYTDADGNSLEVWNGENDAVFTPQFSVVSPPELQKLSYNLKGWSTEMYSQECVSEFESGKDYYAVWEPKTFKLYSGNEEYAVVYGERPSDIKVPSKFGYLFAGGYVSDANGGKVKVFDSWGKAVTDWVWSEDKNLIYRWSKSYIADTFSVTGNPGTLSIDIGEGPITGIVTDGTFSATGDGTIVKSKIKKTGVYSADVKAAGFTFRVVFNVKAAPNKVTISTKKKMKVNNFYSIKAVIPKNTLTTFKWKVNDVSKVWLNTDENTIYARKPGKVKITVVTANGKKNTVTVKIVK